MLSHRISSTRILFRSRVNGLSQLNNNIRLFATEASYTEQQIKKGRPVSPHVTIYKFPLAAISSITNRVTGCVLSVGMTTKLINLKLFINIFILKLINYV